MPRGDNEETFVTHLIHSGALDENPETGAAGWTRSVNNAVRRYDHVALTLRLIQPGGFHGRSSVFCKFTSTGRDWGIVILAMKMR